MTDFRPAALAAALVLFGTGTALLLTDDDGDQPIETTPAAEEIERQQPPSTTTTTTARDYSPRSTIPEPDPVVPSTAAPPADTTTATAAPLPPPASEPPPTAPSAADTAAPVPTPEPTTTTTTTTEAPERLTSSESDRGVTATATSRGFDDRGWMICEVEVTSTLDEPADRGLALNYFDADWTDIIDISAAEFIIEPGDTLTLTFDAPSFDGPGVHDDYRCNPSFYPLETS